MPMYHSTPGQDDLLSLEIFVAGVDNGILDLRERSWSIRSNSATNFQFSGAADLWEIKMERNWRMLRDGGG